MSHSDAAPGHQPFSETGTWAKAIDARARRKIDSTASVSKWARESVSVVGSNYGCKNSRSEF